MNQIIITLLIAISILTNVDAKMMRSSIDDKIMEKTCLGKYTGVFHSFVYFANNETTDDYYVIRTPWLLTYPGRIRDELQKNNMTIIQKRDTQKCGWLTLAHVKMAGASTGTIYRFKDEVKISEDTALYILSDIYPSLEMALLVIGCFILFVILVIAKITICDYN